MNAPTSSSAGAEKLLSSVEAGISRLVEQKTRNPPAQIEADPESIKAAIARLTSNSIDGLEGLMSELQQLQAFLKGEVERVRGEIESALAGVNIIIETIAPWKTISVPTAAARAFRAGPAASAPSPRGAQYSSAACAPHQGLTTRRLPGLATRHRQGIRNRPCDRLLRRLDGNRCT